MKKTLLALAAVALLAVPVVSKAQDTKPTIAVLPFANGGVDPTLAPLGKGVQAMMLNQLASNTNIRVVERDEIQKIMEEQKLSSNGSVDPATIVKVGKLLGAKYMITGTFVTDPAKTMIITVRAFNTETGQIIYTDGSAKGKTDALLDLIAQASNTANTKLNLPQLAPNSPAKREADASTEKNKKMPLAAAMLYAKAVEAQDSGNKEQAKVLYKQVVTAFPYPPAQQALDKLGK